MKIYYWGILIPLFLSCRSAYQTQDFDFRTAPEAPNYESESSWAVLPTQWPKALEEVVGRFQERPADVFFIYPTLFSSKKDSRWNADVMDQEIRNQVLSRAVPFQSSAWAQAANLYVPFYRQAHYRIFVDPYAAQGEEAGELAYRDVKRAFEYYLAHFNKGKPIILAAHSQGSLHAKRLVKDFFDGTSLQSQLIAAYLIGVKINPSEFSHIGPLTSPHSVGGFVSWNTYKQNNLPKRYEKWYKGGVVTNPISWDESKIGLKSSHLGVLNLDKKIYPNSLTVERIDGMLWASVPKVPKRIFLSFIKNYHFADINLFWKDIQQNAVDRTAAWLQQNKGTW
ncbi:MAG: DUF3089 domain-containing protein [Flavobacteriaceae bacterium]